MLAGKSDYGRSQKWGCRGKLALGFKPRSSSHREDHAVLGEKRRERGPRGFGREEKGERTTQLLQSGDPMVATQLMVPGA